MRSVSKIQMTRLELNRPPLVGYEPTRPELTSAAGADFFSLIWRVESRSALYTNTGQPIALAFINQDCAAAFTRACAIKRKIYINPKGNP